MRRKFLKKAVTITLSLAMIISSVGITFRMEKQANQQWKFQLVN